MKPLICEMCGSTDIVRKDGLYVCRACGTKYSVEDAKKGGTVSVDGIDTSAELENLYQIARRAKETNNRESAQRYYDMILIRDPNSWEANFYVGYFGAMQCKVSGISRAAQQVSDSYAAVLDLIIANLSDEEQNDAITEISNKVQELGIMLFNGAYSTYLDIHNSVKGKFSREYMNHCLCAVNLMLLWGDQLSGLNSDKYKAPVVSLWSNGVECLGRALKGLIDDDSRAALTSTANTYQNKISEINPDYQKINYKTGACYIATAVYGSYDCPEVWTLRRFRDHTLTETWYGRTFIRLYYAAGPTLVKWFGHAEWFRNLCLAPLDKLVTHLQKRGVQSTPYNDKF